MKIFANNPGATTTKIALYEDCTELWTETVAYSQQELAHFQDWSEEEELRYSDVMKVLKAHGVEAADIDAFVGRGGLLHPMDSGTWIVNDAMIADLRSIRYGAHASSLGAVLALRLAREAGGRPAYIVDPVCVDEMTDIAHVSGIPDIPRVPIFHALNQRAVGYRVAKQMGKEFKECKFIIAHMGGGVTVGAHYLGRVVDVNNAICGYGPFTPERSGTVHIMEVVKRCYSGKFTFEQMKRYIMGNAGLTAHLGTSDFKRVMEMVDGGDAKAKLVVDAMAYQIACEIGSRSVAMKGEVDAIILTGGLAHSEYLCDRIREHVSWLASVVRCPGEDELRALCEGVFRVLSGKEAAKEYEQEKNIEQQ